MKFQIGERKVMKMLFDLGTVDQISGTYEHAFIKIHWDIIRRPKNHFRDNVCFDAIVSGIYAPISRGTLDEALDALEDAMKLLFSKPLGESEPHGHPVCGGR